VLADPEAYAAVAGTAFHLYGGRPAAMAELAAAHPEKRVFFSEGSEFGVRGAAQMVAILANSASSYSAWVTMLDTNMQPNAGPFKPHSTMLELDARTGRVHYRFEYFMTGHFSKFIRRGAVRVESEAVGASAARSSPHATAGDGAGTGGATDGAPSELLDVVYVAFLNPDTPDAGANQGTLVVVAVNPLRAAAPFQLQWGGLVSGAVDLPPESVTTFRWAAGH
jgi:O-glycosyl hydrolase